MIPVKLFFEEDNRTWHYVTMLAALPTLDGRSVIAVRGLLFVPFEIVLADREQVVKIHVGGYAHLTREVLEQTGWVENYDAPTPQ